ncbi:MAG: Gfo/Idh/MocA family protein [Alphaproteobacteria bacterium]
MLNVAVVGLGWWGRTHVRSLHGKSDKVRITRLVDANLDAHRDFASELNLPLSRDYAEVLADPRIDAVILVTPHSLHTDQIVAAAAAGKHVFTEKPFALSKAEAERAVAAARKADIRLGLGHNQRFSPPQREIKRRIADGALGTVTLLEANTSHDTLMNVRSWRADPKEAPGGGLWHMGSHSIDVFQHWVGRATQVYARRASTVQFADTGVAVISYAGGQTGTVSNVLVTPPSRHIQVFGTGGWARFTGPTELVVCARGGTPEALSFAPEDPVRNNVECFADAVAGRGDYLIAPDEMIHDVAVLDATARSLDSGRPEDVL